jgi:aspartate racemase
MKKLLILGGLGPQASLLFHRRLLSACLERNGVSLPLLVHLSMSIVHNTSKSNKDGTLDRIREQTACLGDLTGFKAVMPCNTLHLAQAEIAEILGVKLVSLADAVKRHMAENKETKFGVMATPISVSHGLYDVEGMNIVQIDDTRLAKLDYAINRVIVGEDPAQFQPVVVEAIDSLVAQGCSSVILGCTELSVIMDTEPHEFGLDPLNLLVKHLIEENHV